MTASQTPVATDDLHNIIAKLQTQVVRHLADEHPAELGLLMELLGDLQQVGALCGISELSSVKSAAVLRNDAADRTFSPPANAAESPLAERRQTPRQLDDLGQLRLILSPEIEVLNESRSGIAIRAAHDYGLKPGQEVQFDHNGFILTAVVEWCRQDEPGRTIAGCRWQ